MLIIALACSLSTINEQGMGKKPPGLYNPQTYPYAVTIIVDAWRVMEMGLWDAFMRVLSL